MKDLVFQTLWIRYSIPLGEQLSLTTTSEYYFMDPAIDRLLAEQLQGKEQHKISINKRGNSLQLRFVGWTDHNLTLGNTISLTVNGCAATLEDLETLLYSSVPHFGVDSGFVETIAAPRYSSVSLKYARRTRLQGKDANSKKGVRDTRKCTTLLGRAH